MKNLNLVLKNKEAEPKKVNTLKSIFSFFILMSILVVFSSCGMCDCIEYCTVNGYS